MVSQPIETIRYKGLIFELIREHNLIEAIKVQNKVFPHEDGSQNFKDSIAIKENPHPVIKDSYYWLVKNENSEPIGTIGYLAYQEYPNVMITEWLGVIAKNRRNGYASAMMDFIREQGIERGYTENRLYTDTVDNAIACMFYRKMGMFEELYDRHDDILTYQPGNIVIFSESLTEKQITPWNNRFLFLSILTDCCDKEEAEKRLQHYYEAKVANAKGANLPLGQTLEQAVERRKIRFPKAFSD